MFLARGMEATGEEWGVRWVDIEVRSPVHLPRVKAHSRVLSSMERRSGAPRCQRHERRQLVDEVSKRKAGRN